MPRRAPFACARLACLLGIAGVAGACSSSTSTAPIEIHTSAALLAPIQAFAAQVPWDPVSVAADADPVASLGTGDGLHVAVAGDLTGCVECFRVDASGSGYVVHADGALGAQYGLATLLEASGFRFRRPLQPSAPATLSPPAATDARLGKQLAAEKKLRGLHLHTLHPIEGYFSHWSAAPDSPPDEADPIREAKRIHAWLVANRGNYIEWVALNDVVTDAARGSAWRERTRRIIEDAHARGLRTGIGVQLFRASDLQRGFDLIDTMPSKLGDDAAIIAELDKRLELLAGLGLDVVNVSFGEFSAFDPATFVRALNLAYREIRARLNAQVVTTVHVGGLPSQRVDYMGENLPYYFLVKFADPGIEPWVHSVMYYNLFEDAGGSYDMDNYDEHRAFLLDRLRAGKPAAYFPETAYWITFDVSVPLYLPLYVRSRFHDMNEIRAAARAGNFGDLAGHVQFSSGFEWGYWQQDRATLRMAYQLPARWEEAFEELFPAELAADVAALTTAQHDALIGKRLAPWFAARDSYIDVGTMVGIHSQPDRPSFTTIAGYDATARAAWVKSVLDPLGQYADSLATIASSVTQHADAGDADQAEVADGVAVDAARARFIHSLCAAAVAKGAGESTAMRMAEARAALDAARTAVARRHAGIRPIYRESTGNATIYPFGYLAKAETLCYWERELAQMANLVEGANATVPGCIF